MANNGGVLLPHGCHQCRRTDRLPDRPGHAEHRALPGRRGRRPRIRARLSRRHLHGAIQLLDWNANPSRHGIVGNGWYDRALAEVHFWKQSNHLVAGPKIWDELRARDPGFTCAQLFWWFNMYSTADYSITPRPAYPADGRKVFDIYSWPPTIRPEIKRDLGEFPFPAFWGPAAGVKARTARRRRLALDRGGGQMDRAKILAHAQPGLSSSS
jgi:hypothetical protein